MGKKKEVWVEIIKNYVDNKKGSALATVWIKYKTIKLKEEEANNLISRGIARLTNIDKVRTEEEIEELSKPKYREFKDYVATFFEKDIASRLECQKNYAEFDMSEKEAKAIFKEDYKLFQLQKDESEKISRTAEKDKKDKEMQEAKEREFHKKQAEKIKKNAEKESEEELQKIMLDKLEKEWETCDDELFIAVMEIDWRKASHFFSLRLMKEHHLITLEESNELLIYDKEEGIYCFNGENYVAAECERRLTEKATISQVKEICEKIKRVTKQPREILYQQPEHLKPVKNGLLNIKTMLLELFSPDYIFINKIDIPFVSLAKCPKFQKFLSEVTSNEIKLPVEKNITLIKQWMGYTLLNDSRFEKALLLYGKGGNGKSVLLKVWVKFLGYKNVVSIPLQYLESNNFAVSRFVGKSANIFTDLPNKALGQTSKFKIIVSGDQLSVERKGKDSYEAKLHTKQIFSCNDVPETPDTSNAFFGRWDILKFYHNFRESPDRIEKYEEQFNDEMSGILNFAIEGLKDILENGFVKHMSRVEVMDFWLRHSDSVAAFNLDMLEEFIGAEELKQNIFESYESYCQIKNYNKEDMKDFWRRLGIIRSLDEVRPGIKAEDRRRYIKDLRLKELPGAKDE